MKWLSIFWLILCPYFASAQLYSLQGMLADTTGRPIANAAVSLLETADSTLAFFGISNSSGHFEISTIKAGNYLLQVASIGHRIYYKPMLIPVPANNLGYIILKATETLSEVEIRSSKIPMLLRGDTIEYNAGAFKVKEDAVVEDLLRKLPGIQLDKSGNIKAQGKDVRKVLVDGKEFFGDDPKMATKNLPADAIDKVQVFGKRSDAAQFSGIDDGTRDQTINLQLKDGKRKGYFGDVEAGGGTDDHYKLSAKLYRFQPQRQFAALGMLNNINQFGFSFQDYMSFQGGLRGMMDGNGGGMMRMATNMPINFGQPVTGLITSGAAGLNYSADARPGNRFTISYLGNGADKRLSEQRTSRNFASGTEYITSENEDQHSRDLAHRLNFGWRNDIDSSNQFTVRGGATLTTNTGNRTLLSRSGWQDTLRNALHSLVEDGGSGVAASLGTSYLKKFRGSAWPVWKLSASGMIETSATGTNWNNTSSLLSDTMLIGDRQYQNNNPRHITWDAGTSVVRELGAAYYLEPALKVGSDVDALSRRQGILYAANETDSLSPQFSRSWNWLRPGISFRHNTSKVQLSIGVEAEVGDMNSELIDGGTHSARYQFLKPSAFYQNAYTQGAQINLAYTTDVSPAPALQMLPVTNYQNPLQRVTGNPLLRPEYRHILQAGWLRFDQFSLTSLMFHLRGTYTHDKISWARHIDRDLIESQSYINVPDDYLILGSTEYNTPLRKFGLTLTVAFEERYTRGQSLVNDVMNWNTTFNHNLRLSLANRKSPHWDIESGVEADITDNLTSQDAAAGRARFYHYIGYARLSYKPCASFNISLSANVDHYSASNFPDAVTIPLINASASYYFLKYRRGALSFEAFDLLYANKSFQRVSQLNYLLERRTNIIQQYFLLSFKYRLSKAGTGKGAVDVQIKR